MSGHVLVVGDLMVDLLVVPSGPLQHGSDTPARIRALGGGSAANTACWLASLGRPVRLVASVGDDALAPGAVADLAAAGVVAITETVPGRSTGTCVVLVDPDGERTMLPDRGANDALPVDLVERAFTSSQPAWLHLSGYSLIDEGSRPAARTALARARAAGVRTSVDASSAAPLRTLGPDRFLDWIEGIDLLLGNDDELDALGGAAACRDRVRVVVAKHGPDGASWLDGTAGWSEPAAPTEVVDTVGAGDALDAGIIDAVLRGLDPPAALVHATEVAARAVATTGARPT